MIWRACVLALAAFTESPAGAADEASAKRGRQLFLGEAALSARIVGQDFALPPHASRCVNCHGSSAVAVGASSALLAAPTLSAATLAQAMRRRGGPPSRYDAVALCRLLRSGVDPAHVLIERTMPRYDISDTDCRSLWQHLSQ